MKQDSPSWKNNVFFLFVGYFLAPYIDKIFPGFLERIKNTWEGEKKEDK